MLNSKFALIVLFGVFVVFIFNACEQVSDDDPRMKAHQQAIEKGKQRSNWINKVGEADKKPLERKSETSKDARQNAPDDKSVDKNTDNQATKNANTRNNENRDPKSSSNKNENNSIQSINSEQKPGNFKNDKGADSFQQNKNGNTPKTLQEKVKERLENAASKENKNIKIKEKGNKVKQQGKVFKNKLGDTIQKKSDSFQNNIDSIKQKMKNAVEKRKNQFNKTDSLN